MPDDLRKPAADPSKVPEPLRTVIGKREVWRSYGAITHAAARKRHNAEMARLDALFAEARRWRAAQDGIPVSAELAPAPTAEDVRAAVQLWLHREERRRLSAPPDGYNPSEAAENLKDEERLLHGEYGEEYAADMLPAVLEFFGLGQPAPGVRTFALRLMQQAILEGVRRDLDRNLGRVAIVHDPAFTDVNGAAAPPPAPARPSITFRALCDRYLEAPERAGLSIKAQVRYRGSARVFGEIFGPDTAAATITREDCRRAQAVLLEMPANAVHRYPGVTAPDVPALAKRDNIPPMHTASVSNHFDYLAQLFRWGMREGLARFPDGNPAEGLKLPKAKSGEKRRPFTNAELQAIFKAPPFTGCLDDAEGYASAGPNRPRRGRFWVPLVAMWTGLRLNEACQLTTADVLTVDGIPLLHVRAIAKDQSVKTENADRRVPLHPELVRLGFLHYVEKQRQAGETRLFPELPRSKAGAYSDAFSKWFGTLLEKQGITARGAVFHSFRHGFRDRMREDNVPRDVAEVIGGWSSAGQAAKYGSGYSLASLAEHMAKITYPGLDLSHLYPPEKPA